MLLPEDIKDIVATLRELGVRHYSYGDFRIELGEAPPQSPTPLPAEEICPCGHERFEHDHEGHCYHCTAPNACVKKKD